jgi:hypothetical protein
MTRSSSSCWEKGTDINASDRYYGSVLYAASARGHNRVVELLLGKGTDARWTLRQRATGYIDDRPQQDR